jgi:hypothetical protein
MVCALSVEVSSMVADVPTLNVPSIARSPPRPKAAAQSVATIQHRLIKPTQISARIIKRDLLEPRSRRSLW